MYKQMFIGLLNPALSESSIL